MSSDTKRHTGKDAIPFFQANPALAPDLVLLDTDNIDEWNILRERIRKDINPNLIDKIETYVGYVLRYNIADRHGVGSACASVGPGGKGIVTNRSALAPDSVNAIIPELNFVTPLPAQFVQSNTKRPADDLCNKGATNADRVCNMAPLFEIPNTLSHTIVPGNFVVVRLYDGEFPAKGGTVVDVVKNKKGEIKMAPLKPRGSVVSTSGKECPPATTAGSEATGDAPYPQEPTATDSGVEAYEDLLIIKKHGLVDAYSKRGKKSLPKCIVYHYTGAPATPAGTLNTFRSRGVSSHYEVDRNGVIHEYLDPSEYIAWHVKANNTLSIGVDLSHNPRCSKKPCWPEKQINATKKLTAYLCKRFDISPSVAPTRCGPATNSHGWPSGMIRGGDCRKEKERASKLIDDGYTLLRHYNCNSTHCPGDFPIQRVAPSKADIAKIKTSEDPSPECLEDSAPGSDNLLKDIDKKKRQTAAGVS